MSSPMLLVRLLIFLALAQSSHTTLVDLRTASSAAKIILKRTKFDYVVIGGGTAGITVAKRLSENAENSVLVLEAGGTGDGDELVTIPKNSFAFVGTDIDWGYEISAQEHAAGQEINLSQGKILGGDSAVNGLVWVRGAKEEYDAFEDLGSRGWNWNSLYSYMKKSETLVSPSAALVKEYGYVVKESSHGSKGPVEVSFPPYLPIQHSKLVQASVELGHTFNMDPYSGNNTGVYFSLSSQTANATRETSEFAYLTNSANKTNLVVFEYAIASKIVTTRTRSGAKATGVEVAFPDGSVNVARVHSEVILSAGALRTPQILELSGIGDKSVLALHGINVKVDLPGVGANYEDHTLTILTYELKQGLLSFDALGYNQTLAEEASPDFSIQKELYKQGKGWLTFAQAVVNFEPFEKILTASEIEEAKEILKIKPNSIPEDQFEIMKRQVLTGTPQIEYLLFNSFSGGAGKKANTSYISLAVTHVHPLSRGSVHINSTSINDHPKIDPNFLDSEWDNWILAKASAYGRKMFQTKAFQEIVVGEVYPGPSIQSDADWIQYVKKGVNSGYHSVGTASLLPREKNGVVDAKLKVYGTTNIRVVDVSVLPLHISSHTQTVAYAVGEKAADLIGRGSKRAQ